MPVFTGMTDSERGTSVTAGALAKATRTALGYYSSSFGYLSKLDSCYYCAIIVGQFANSLSAQRRRTVEVGHVISRLDRRRNHWRDRRCGCRLGAVAKVARAGAGLMAIVVAKLFFVDLFNVCGIERIVSFTGVGLLMLVVG